jgi:VanZ family protein
MVESASALRAFRRPRVWLSLWAIMIVAVIALSLMRGPPIPNVLAIGKFDHWLAYFALTAMAVQLYAGRRAHIVAAIAMTVLGIGLEFAQGYLTTWRDMSAYDGAIDTFGVAAGLALAWTRFANILQKIDAKLFGRISD